jgi:hypothetical protein
MRKGLIRAILPCALVLAFISAQIFILLYLRSRAGHPSMLPDEEPRAGKRRQARLERETPNFNLKGRNNNGEDMSMHQNPLAVPPSIISMAPSANSTTTTTLSSSSPSSPTGNANRSQVRVDFSRIWHSWTDGASIAPTSDPQNARCHTGSGRKRQFWAR